MQKFGRLIVDIWPLGRLRSRWKNNCQLDQKEIDRRWMRLNVVMPTGGFWYYVEHSVLFFSPSSILHIMFSKVEIKCNSELEVKKRVVWLVY